MDTKRPTPLKPGRPHRNPTILHSTGSTREPTLSDLPASPDPHPGTSPADKLPWLAKLATYLASFAAGAAVNDLSTTLGYHGLAGAIALLGVVTAATWIRGLDPRARLPRGAPWLFLAPAACAAATAALSSGAAADILTAIAAILTVGAVLIARELQSAARLLAGAALIVGGAAVIAGGTASIADGNTPLGAAVLPAGVAFIAGGIAHIGDRDRAAGAALITAGAAVIATGTAVIATGTVINFVNTTVGLVVIFWIGASVITDGPVLIIGSRRPPDVALYRDHIRQAKRALAPLYSAMGAVTISILAGGLSRFAKGVTPAGSAHIAERDILALVATGALLAATGVLWAAAIGPRAIASRARQAIDWATKPPRAIQEPGSRSQPASNPESQHVAGDRPAQTLQLANVPELRRPGPGGGLIRVR